MFYPRKIKGFRDIDEKLNRLRWHIIEKATEVYRKYGYEHWDTPIMEYAETLGKYLPEANEVSGGIYSFRNPEIEPVVDEKGNEVRDEANNVVMQNHYLALRYDLTAPLARLYSELIWSKFVHNQVKEGRSDLFRRYQFGPVFRYEAKLDPGRFREFWQLDFDTVGADSVAVDAENCMILSEALENIGLPHDKYRIKINNRKLLKGILFDAGVPEEFEADVLRIIDKQDKIGIEGVKAELGKGRQEKSGAFIAGLNLPEGIIEKIINFLNDFDTEANRDLIIEILKRQNIDNEYFRQGLKELEEINEILKASGFNDDTIVISPSLIRGMAYYTGPVFEAEFVGTYTDAKGRKRQVGAICGGGRYDGLVEQLIGLKVPASGASIGVDRLAEILTLTGLIDLNYDGPVFIANFDDNLQTEYQAIARELRKNGIDTEIYYGAKRGLKQQLSYADKKNSPVAILLGEDEFNAGVVTVRNLKLGKELASTIKDKKEWTNRVQKQVARDQLTNEILKILKQ